MFRLLKEIRPWKICLPIRILYYFRNFSTNCNLWWIVKLLLWLDVLNLALVLRFFWTLSCTITYWRPPIAQKLEERPVGIIIIVIIINYSLTARVVEAPQMMSQPVLFVCLFVFCLLFFFIFPCSPLPSGTWRTPGRSVPWCCLPTSYSVCLVIFPLSLCLARWFWPDLMNGRHVHTTAVVWTCLPK